MDESTKHPLSPPFDASVDTELHRVDILQSTIGAHDFKLTFRDPETLEIKGYGWFDRDLAAELLGVPFEDDVLPMGAEAPETIRSEDRAVDMASAPPAPANPAEVAELEQVDVKQLSNHELGAVLRNDVDEFEKADEVDVAAALQELKDRAEADAEDAREILDEIEAAKPALEQ